MELLKRASSLIRSSRALLLTAGAGMSVDSGLPDFRSPEGFWNSYPPMAKLGLSFAQMSTPLWFRDDPEFAWGFFGHRLNLYNSTSPHEGFKLLLELAQSKPERFFVLTSNVDGHFQKAGFPEDRIYEIHGSVHYWQCYGNCEEIWKANQKLIIDEDSFRAQSPLPLCPNCGRIARPNILMFNDLNFNETRSGKQMDKFDKFIKKIALNDTRLIVIEIGCGLAVPTVRLYGQQILSLCTNSHMIRINPHDQGNSDITANKILYLRTTAFNTISNLFEFLWTPSS